MVFPTKYSEDVKQGTFEVNLNPSMTEPDNAMSIPEIIARFTRGQGIQVPVYEWEQGSADEGGVAYDDLQDFFGPPASESAPAAEPEAAAAAKPAAEPAPEA